MTVLANAVTAEYEAARTTAIVVARTDRAFVRMYGRDPVKMIQGLITNDLAGAAPERAVYAGMLTPKGKLLADLRAYRRGIDVLLEMDSTALQNVLDNLKKFVPPLFARAEDVSAQYSVVGVYGARARLVATAVGRVPPVAGEMTELADGSWWVGTDYIGGQGFDLITPAAAAQQTVEQLVEAGGLNASLETLNVLRIEAGTPRWGAELDESVIPLEAGLRERMISESKGCYTGQEIIVRILHRGHVNWMLRGALLGAQEPPSRGTALLAPDGAKQIGRITSACVSPRYGQTIAMCYARRELELPAGALLAESQATARIVELPFKEAK